MSGPRFTGGSEETKVESTDKNMVMVYAVSYNIMHYTSWTAYDSDDEGGMSYEEYCDFKQEEEDEKNQKLEKDTQEVSVKDQTKPLVIENENNNNIDNNDMD